MGPRVLHQLVVSRLHDLFSGVNPPGLIVMADLTVDSEPRFQRDISIVRAFRIPVDLLAVPAGQVLMAVEVVRASSRRRDWIHKRREYARLGIPNYMLVELSGSDAPSVYYQKLRGGVYYLGAKAHAGQRIRIDDPIVVEFDPAELVEVDV